jgi:hypothetical protein
MKGYDDEFSFFGGPQRDSPGFFCPDSRICPDSRVSPEKLPKTIVWYLWNKYLATSTKSPGPLIPCDISDKKKQMAGSPGFQAACPVFAPDW